MRKENKIKNLDDLRLEIYRLKALAREQEMYLNDQYTLFNERIEAPIRFVKSAISWIPGVDLAKGLFAKSKGNEDWVTKAFRIGLPVIMNRFFLRNSGFVKRAVATLFSQQVAGNMTQDRLSTLIGKITNFIKPKGRKKTKAREDYGIPPDSETF